MLIDYRLNQTIVGMGPVMGAIEGTLSKIGEQTDSVKTSLIDGIAPFPILGIYDINPSFRWSSSSQWAP